MDGSRMKLAGIDVARIGLGTNRLTRTPDHVAFIKAAVAAGVQMIDTAHLYTGGQSEETIGAALSGGAGRLHRRHQRRDRRTRTRPA